MNIRLAPLCLLLIAGAAGPVHAQPAAVVTDGGVAVSAPAGATWARAVAVDPPALRAAADARSPIAVEVGSRRVVAHPSRAVRRAAGGVSWFGAAGDDGARVTLTLAGDRLIGRIVTPEGLIVIEPAGAGHVAYEPGVYPEEAGDAIRVPAAEAPEAFVPDVLFPDEMHLMVVYTPAVAASLGASLAAFIQGSEDVVNDVLQNSLVPIRARVVSTHLASYTESGNMSSDLSRLRNAADGFMDEVHPLRTAYSADMVALIVQSASNNCGVAYLMDPIRGEFHSSAFSVTRRSCAIGNLTFPHELGHNIGLRHDRFVDQSNTPFTYSHGFVNDDSLARGRAGYRTTLAYNDQCTSQGGTCIRLPYFSHPGLSFDGFVLGDPVLAHNAEAAAFSLPTVAAFRAATLLADDSGTTAGAPFFARPHCPDPTDLQLCVAGDTVRYVARTLQVSPSGLHHVRAIVGHDAVLLLYTGDLDPSEPLHGLVGYAEPDTSAPSLRRLMVSAGLADSTSYTIVLAGDTAPDAGPWALEIYGPPNGGIVVQAAGGPPPPDGYAVAGPAPNPFRGVTTITVMVAESQHVRAEVLVVLGRRTAVLHDGAMAAGVPVALHFDGTGVAPGTYLVRIAGATFGVTERATLLR